MKPIVYVLFLIPFIGLATGLGDDPSSVPVQDDGAHGVERYRILADFNGDGIRDMALSIPIGFFGNGGGQFELFIRNAQGQYRKIGEFFAHPLAVALEHAHAENRLWTYAHGGGGVGSIGYCEITPVEVSEYHGLTIPPGDGGTRMGNAIYDAVFKHSDPTVRSQISETRGGVVTWKDLPRTP